MTTNDSREKFYQLSSEELKRIINGLNEGIKNPGMSRGEILRKCSKELPKEVEPSEVRNPYIYPHYIPKGYTKKDIVYDEYWGQYMIIRGKEAPFVYIPIYQLDKTISLIEKEFIIPTISSYEIKAVYKKPVKKMLKVLHGNFVKAVRERPLIKGVWIVSAYPSVGKYGEIQFLSTTYNQVYVTEAWEIIDALFRERKLSRYQLVPRTVYFSLIAYVIQKYYDFYNEINRNCYFLETPLIRTIYMAFLTGMPHIPFKIKIGQKDIEFDEMQEIFSKSGNGEMLTPEEKHIIRPFTGGIQYKLRGVDKCDVYTGGKNLCGSDKWRRNPMRATRSFCCNAMCNLPLDGWLAIYCRDDDTGEIIKVKVPSYSATEIHWLTSEYFALGLLEEEGVSIPTRYSYKKTFIAMLKEE